MKKFSLLLTLVCLAGGAFAQSSNFRNEYRNEYRKIHNNVNNNRFYGSGFEKLFEYKIQTQTNYDGWYDYNSDDHRIDHSLNSQGLTFFAGYRINSYLFFGLGTGIEYSYSKAESFGNKSYDRYAFSVPMLARVKFNLLKTRVTPYCSIDIGYNANVADNYKAGDRFFSRKESGTVLESTLGIEINTTRWQSVYIGIVGLGTLLPSNDDIYNFYSFKVGLRF